MWARLNLLRWEIRRRKQKDTQVFTKDGVDPDQQTPRPPLYGLSVDRIENAKKLVEQLREKLSPSSTDWKETFWRSSSGRVHSIRWEMTDDHLRRAINYLKTSNSNRSIARRALLAEQSRRKEWGYSIRKDPTGSYYTVIHSNAWDSSLRAEINKEWPEERLAREQTNRELKAAADEPAAQGLADDVKQAIDKQDKVDFDKLMAHAMDVNREVQKRLQKKGWK